MATPNTTSSSKSPANTNTKPVEATKPVDAKTVEAPQPNEPVQAGQQAAQAPTNEPAKTASGDAKKPVTLMIPERLGRRLRLVAQAEGITLTTLLLSAVEEGLAERFRRAIEVLNADG